MLHAVAIWIALAIFGAGLAYKASAWFRLGLEPAGAGLSPLTRFGAALRGTLSTIFSAKVFALLGSFVLDVLVQRKILRQSVARWLAHVAIFSAFGLLLLMHALGSVLTIRFFPGYASTLNPFLFLRDLLGAVLLGGLAIATVRRYFLAVPRRRTRASDSWAIAIIVVILASGVLLEGLKITSYSEFRRMAQEYGAPADEAPLAAWWGTAMGTVVPGARPTPELVARGRELHEQGCAGCHSAPQAGFLGVATATVLRPAAPALDAAGAVALLWAIHFYACLIGLAYLPFSKLFHVFATPLSLMTNAVVVRGSSLPANVATKQMLELDACTHCCSCSAHCSVAMAADVAGNETILPSERISALKALASGRALAPEWLRSLQEGVCICTSCERCTVTCPSGIDLLGLWLSVKETLLARGEPAYPLLSPLSLRRALMKEQLGPTAYREPVARSLRAIAAQVGFAQQSDRAVALRPGEDRLWTALQGSVQAGTVASCFGCKSCSTACPVVRSHPDPAQALGLLPHQIMYAARLRLWGLALGCNMLWDCLGCYECQEHCPQGVGTTDIMYELKNVAIARATVGKRLETGVAT
jgi:heterodisulfide reductase subunit C/nitrate reductase gamma subunit